MQTECFRIKVKEGALPLVREWANRLNERGDQVRELLYNEGVAIESVFLDRVGSDHYLVYYMRGPDLNKASEIAQASQHPIDIYHRDMLKKIGAGFTEMQKLVDFSSIDPL